MKSYVILEKAVFDSLSNRTQQELMNLNSVFSNYCLGSKKVTVRIVPESSSKSLQDVAMILDNLIKNDYIEKELLELREMKRSLEKIKDFINGSK